MTIFMVLSSFQHRELANPVFYVIDRALSVQCAQRFSFQGIWSTI